MAPLVTRVSTTFGFLKKKGGLSVTGGNTTLTEGGYNIHIFTGPGTLSVTGTGTVEYVVVAGGGGGGRYDFGNNYGGGGGGGAGGFRTATGFSVSSGSYEISVGGGGPGAPTTGNGSNGIPSYIGPPTAKLVESAGGGFGSGGPNGGPGGSGGGGTGLINGTSAGGTGNTPPVSPPQGNNGGNGWNNPNVFSAGGGGGGAGGAGGTDNNTYTGGPAGVGAPVTWIPASYGTPGPAPGRYFSTGGRGAIGIQPGDVGVAGPTNSGNGGGGSESSAGAAGGSGIVIIRYPVSLTTPSTTSIVTSGLTVYLDAANTSSYPGSGATWTDLSGSGNNMTLTNSPTFSTNNGGILQFNGSNQYGSLSLNYSTTNHTIMAASRYSGATRGRVISSNGNNWLFGHWSSGSEEYYAEGWVYEGTSNDTNWRIYAGLHNYTSDQISFYSNNVALVTNSTAGSQGFNGLAIGRWGFNNTEYSTCEVSFILVYNRLLTTDELTQNFNALRGRYGL